MTAEPTSPGEAATTTPGGATATEARLLQIAREYSFRGRMDKGGFSGPVLKEGKGSIVKDVNGKEYLDYNSGQMCSALEELGRPR